jgi:hypothetical protein
MTIATWNHAKELGYCSAGIRRWCEARGIDPLQFVRNGVSTDWLRRQGDAMAERLADYAEKRQHG